MRKITFLGFIVCLCGTATLAGDIDDASKSIVFLSNSIPVTQNVQGVPYEVYLKNPTNNALTAQRIPVSASGLIVATSNACYLVTAKHVASVMTPDCEMAMSGDSGEAIYLRFPTSTGQPPDIGWVNHSNANVSVCPLPVRSIEALKAIQNRAFPFSSLVGGTNIISRDVNLTILGFPLGLGAQDKIIPFSRDTKIAHGWLHDANGYYYLLQDPAVSGYSGGPLIESSEANLVNKPSGIGAASGGARCWGFVSGTVPDETGGKCVELLQHFTRWSLYAKLKLNCTVNRKA